MRRPSRSRRGPAASAMSNPTQARSQWSTRVPRWKPVGEHERPRDEQRGAERQQRGGPAEGNQGLRKGHRMPFLPGRARAKAGASHKPSMRERPRPFPCAGGGDSNPHPRGGHLIFSHPSRSRPISVGLSFSCSLGPIRSSHRRWALGLSRRVSLPLSLPPWRRSPATSDGERPHGESRQRNSSGCRECTLLDPEKNRRTKRLVGLLAGHGLPSIRVQFPAAPTYAEHKLRLSSSGRDDHDIPVVAESWIRSESNPPTVW